MKGEGMKRIFVLGTMTAALLWTAGVAFGQTGTAPEQTPVKPATPVTPEMQPAPQVTPPPQATTPPAPDASVKTEGSAGIAVIVAKAKKAPPLAAEETEKKIRESVKLVEKEAAVKGEVVASRLAAEFGVPAETLTNEKGTYQTGWGELMIAHTVLANAKGVVTLDQLFEMRRDGLGWGQIGHGLDLDLGGVASAVKAESRVATGAAKADGKPAKIPGAAAKANAETKVGAAAGSKGAGAAADVGVGATVKQESGK
jgi:hypothetical protein